MILFEGTSYYTVYYQRDTSVYSTNSSYFIGIGLDNGTKPKWHQGLHVEESLMQMKKNTTFNLKCHKLSDLTSSDIVLSNSLNYENARKLP